MLNGESFYSLREAQILIERWRHHYNTVRPHSALGYRPQSYAQKLVTVRLGGVVKLLDPVLELNP